MAFTLRDHALAIVLTTISAWACRAPAQADALSVVGGAHYEIRCDFRDDVLAAHALEAAEAVWPVATRLLGDETLAPKKRAPIHVYLTREEYEAADAEFTRGRFRRNLGFSDWYSVTSHLMLQPPMPAATRARLGLPAQTRRIVAHEAAHLATFVAYPNAVRHPLWFTEGLAQWLEDEALLATKFTRELAADPDCSQTMVIARGLAARKRLPRLKAILDDDLRHLSFHEVYAVRRWFFRMLMALHREPMTRVLRRARTFPEKGGFNERFWKTLREELGGAAFRRLEQDFPAYLSSLKPRWRQTSRSLDVARMPWVQAAHPTEPAFCWREQPVGSSRYRLATTLEILPGPGDEANLCLDRQPQGFLSLALSVSRGVRLFGYRADGETWDVLARSPSRPLVAGRKVALVVDVAPRALRVRIGDRLVLEAEPGARPLSGPWGLGAQSATVALWGPVAIDTSTTPR